MTKKKTKQRHDMMKEYNGQHTRKKSKKKKKMTEERKRKKIRTHGTILFAYEPTIDKNGEKLSYYKQSNLFSI